MPIGNFPKPVSEVVVNADGTGNFLTISGALDFVAATGGAVTVQPGTYLISTAIQMKSNVDLRASGKSAIIKVADNTAINAIECNNINNFSIRGLCIDGNHFNQTRGTDTSKQQGIWVHSGCSDFIIDEMKVIDTPMSPICIGSFTAPYGCTDGIIANNICDAGAQHIVPLSENSDQGIGVWWSERIIVDSNICRDSGWAGINLWRSKDCIVNGNVVEDNYFSSGEGHGITSEGSRSCIIIGNTVRDNQAGGIMLSWSWNDEQYSEDIAVLNNIVEEGKGFGGALTKGIVLWCSRRALVSGNIIRDNPSHGIEIIGGFAIDPIIIGNSIYGNGLAGIFSSGSVDDALVANNAIYENANSGILFISSNRLHITGNRLQANLIGIDLRGCKYCNVIGNTSIHAAGSGIYLKDNGADYCLYNLIAGNWSGDDRGGSATQQWGIYEAENSDYNLMISNILYGNIYGSLYKVGVHTKATGNIGYITENHGTDAIASGATSKAISHGCNYTPLAEDITITPTNNPTNDPGNLWISAIGGPGETFTVNCRNDPGVSTLTFAWGVKAFSG